MDKVCVNLSGVESCVVEFVYDVHLHVPRLGIVIRRLGSGRSSLLHGLLLALSWSWLPILLTLIWTLVLLLRFLKTFVKRLLFHKIIIRFYSRKTGNGSEHQDTSVNGVLEGGWSQADSLHDLILEKIMMFLREFSFPKVFSRSFFVRLEINCGRSVHIFPNSIQILKASDGELCIEW